jgi:hypothetical protein
VPRRADFLEHLLVAKEVPGDDEAAERAQAVGRRGRREPRVLENVHVALGEEVPLRNRRDHRLLGGFRLGPVYVGGFDGGGQDLWQGRKRWSRKCHCTWESALASKVRAGYCM